MVNGLAQILRLLSCFHGQLRVAAIMLVFGLPFLMHGAETRVAAAADASGEFKVFGSGTLTCQRWLDDRRERNPSAVQSEMWVAGYLSAYNQFVHRGADVTQPYDGGFVLDWLDEYCRKWPKSQVNVAARELLEMLRRRR